MTTAEHAAQALATQSAPRVVPLKGKISGDPITPALVSGLLQATIPEYTKWPNVVQGAFLAAWRRYVAGCSSPRALRPEEAVALGADLADFITLPIVEAWGFQRAPTTRAFVDYALAMLHALMLVMPERGQGRPIEKHPAFRPRRGPRPRAFRPKKGK